MSRELPGKPFGGCRTITLALFLRLSLSGAVAPHDPQKIFDISNLPSFSSHGRSCEAAHENEGFIWYGKYAYGRLAQPGNNL